MKTISGWMTKNMPDTYEFIRNFFKALNNKPGGHSLRKWMSIGFFWLTCALCTRYTDSNNLVSVITILCGMITSLIITYSVSNYHEKKLDKTPAPDGGTNEQQQ